MISQVSEVGVGTALMVDGLHVTFVDPRNHGKAEAMLKDARAHKRRLCKKGLSTDTILISVSANIRRC